MLLILQIYSKSIKGKSDLHSFTNSGIKKGPGASRPNIPGNVGDPAFFGSDRSKPSFHFIPKI
jgi:hypothetical protein